MLLNRNSVGAIVTAAALTMTVAGAAAFDESKYPDWSGQWQRPRGAAFPNVGNQWDQTKPPGLGQQAPLMPEYQARLVASLADQAQGGQGLDNLYKCITNGMPRVMSFTFPVEFVILPNITYVHFEIFMPRRIYTDGRDFPKDEEPSFSGLFDRNLARHRRRRPLRHARSRNPQFQGTAHAGSERHAAA